MITTDPQAEILQRLSDVRRLCLNMRFGQMLATIAMLGEDATGRSLWDLDDEEFAAAVERLAEDLQRRQE